ETPGAALHVELAVAELHAAVDDHLGGRALDLEAFEDAAVGLRVMRARAARAGGGGIVDYEIGVGARRDRALARIEPEDPRGIRAAERDHALQVEAALADAVRVHHL